MPLLHPSWTRRRLLRAGGLLAANAFLPGALFAKTGADSRFVVVILRGALDGLSAVPPHGDPNYAGLHRDLAIAAPGSLDGALPLDATFGLHPSLAFLHEKFIAGELVVFHAAASPYRDRSHFDGQNVLENGFSHPLGTADGWLNRALTANSHRAVTVSQNVPLILRGDTPVLSKSPVTAPDVDDDLLARLADLYSKDDWFSARLSEAGQTQRMADGADAMAASKVDRFGAVARMASTLMNSKEGPEVAVVEAGGWDTHANQGGAHGQLATRLAGLDSGIRAFAEGLGTLWQRTAMLVVTEFGRTAAMNGTRGTDHGTGGCAFLTGGAVRGGRVVADWPGLHPAALLDGRDLRPTLDLRSLFKTVLEEHLRVDSDALANRVFPDSKGARPLQGLIRA